MKTHGSLSALLVVSFFVIFQNLNAEASLSGYINKGTTLAIDQTLAQEIEEAKIILRTSESLSSVESQNN